MSLSKRKRKAKEILDDLLIASKNILDTIIKDNKMKNSGEKHRKREREGR
ncbi:MAG: hypothetical protein ACTSSP_04140 [Candidatus Asgardarchaeia archaeon]